MDERIILTPKHGVGYSHDFETQFNTEMSFNSNYALALKSMTMWNSWNNIDAKYNNNKLIYSKDGGETWDYIIFDNGNYTLKQINNYLMSIFQTSETSNTPILFGIDEPTGRFGIILQDNCQVDFISSGELYKILGFNQTIYTTTTIAPNFANISRGVDKIQIHCSLVRDSRYGKETSTNILYQFSPTTPPHALIIIKETDPIFVRTFNDSTIRRIRMTITDQNNNIIDLNEQDVEYELIFRPI